MPPMGSDDRILSGVSLHVRIDNENIAQLYFLKEDQSHWSAEDTDQSAPPR